MMDDDLSYWGLLHSLLAEECHTIEYSNKVCDAVDAAHNALDEDAN